MEDHGHESSYLDITPTGLNWTQNRRLKFIDFRLRWEGRINRNDLSEFFDISMPQATSDLARYQEIAPDNLEYDRSTKAYLRTPVFQPLFSRSSSKFYLTELFALNSGIVEEGSTFLKWSPPVATLPALGRQVDGEILVRLLEAVRAKRMIHVQYQSVTRPSATQRILSPHGFANDGFRWHVRAFCHARKKFLDFVIARIAAVEVGTMSAVPNTEDQEWHTELTLRIGPSPGLLQASRLALELDYEMVDGVLEVKCRHAMLYYTLLQFGLLQEIAIPEKQHLVLLNREELQPYLEMLLASSGPAELQALF